MNERPTDVRRTLYHLWIVPGIIITGFAYAYWWYFIAGAGNPYPRNTFLCDPQFRFSDLVEMLGLNKAFAPYTFPNRSIYPPFANAVFGFLGKLGFLPAAFLVLVVPVLLAARTTWSWAKEVAPALRFWILMGVILAAYPVWFAIDRGNIDLWVMASLFLFASGLGRKSVFGLRYGPLALGFATALKLYPAVFAILYLREKRYTEAILAMGSALIFTVFGAMLLDGGVPASIIDFKASASSGLEVVSGGWLYARFNTGLFHAFWLAEKLWAGDSWRLLRENYASLAQLAALGTLALLLTRRGSRESAFCLVCTAAVLLPPLSNDYRLTIMIPALLLTVLKREKHLIETGLVYLIAMLLIPKNYIILFPTEGLKDVGISSLLNPLLLALVWLVSAAHTLIATPTTKLTNGK